MISPNKEFIASFIVLYISVAAGDILDLGKRQEKFFLKHLWARVILVWMISFVAVGGFTNDKSGDAIVKQNPVFKDGPKETVEFEFLGLRFPTFVMGYSVEKIGLASVLTIVWFVLQLI